ncbi:helix-turn-helix domain-containing protein [Pelomonas sp. KK5]|uniref:helix-turn-helix domain-containing protein n=1 Tax=Pelomonas sp. KK5 TaxID=1855730 RepID=UPI00097BBE32|nr:helix-turn-helix domain-containing protein [Pelomonas sp. KK5]
MHALPASSTPQVRQFAVSDVDEHTSQLVDWDMRYEQLDGGAFQGSFTDIRWPGVQLFIESTSRRVRQRGSLPPGAIGIGTVLAGAGELCINGTRGGPETLIAVHGAELDFCTPAQCTLAGLVVDAPLLQAAALSMMPVLEPLLDGGGMLALSAAGAVLAPLHALLRQVADTVLRRPAEAVAPLRDELLLHTLSALDGASRFDADDLRRPDQRKRLVDRACELMMATPDDPPSLAEVCRHVGASPRKLTYCFQDVLGLSPARYIKAIRLNAVRRDLRRAAEASDASVYDVAARWGFWHFGHFSADYKRQFAELPSQTLRGG